ncbi:MAG: peptidoglycan-associated lipoprotein Pal [Pseudomonadota bacterium]
MSTNTAQITRFCMVAGLSLLLGACASQSLRPTASNLTDATGNGAYGQNGQRQPVKRGTAQDFTVNVGSTVYFETDSVTLTARAQQTLRNQAAWLGQYPAYAITVEGHADERGTREYNIGLGARRALAVKQFLAANGIPAQRLRTTSFGKERPVAVCNDISCWSQNRRSVTRLERAAG